MYVCCMYVYVFVVRMICIHGHSMEPLFFNTTLDVSDRKHVLLSTALFRKATFRSSRFLLFGGQTSRLGISWYEDVATCITNAIYFDLAVLTTDSEKIFFCISLHSTCM